MKAPSLLDDENPDEALRSRHLLGLQVLYGFQAKDGEWTDGTVYDPKIGKTFKAKLIRIEDSTLKMDGCIGRFCKKEMFSQFTSTQKGATAPESDVEN